VERSGGSFQFHTNNLGLRRDVDTPTEKGANLFRVLVLGDSQTDGYVDNPESFSSRLESGLGSAAELAGQRVEVLNAGVAGYSPAQEFLWYDVHGAELKPDLTIVMFYPGNDALDLLDPSKPDVNVATGRAIPPREDFPSYEKGGSLSQLRLGLLARYTVQVGPLSGLWRQLGLPGRLTEAGGYPTDTLVQVFRTCHGCYLQSLQQAARARREPQPMQNAISRAAAILIRLDREVQENGGRLVVAVLPTQAQVEPELARPSQRAVAGLLGLDEAALGFEDEVSQRVVGLLTAGGVPTVRLEEPLKAASRQRAAEAPASGSTMTQQDSVESAQALYYSRDWHLNPTGHRAAADALARGLTESRLVGVRPAGPPSP